MKTTVLKSLIVATAVGLLGVLNASAQEQSVIAGSSVATADYRSYFSNGLQDDAAAAPGEAPSVSDALTADGGGDAGCTTCNTCTTGCALDCPDADPSRLFDCFNNTNCRGLTVTGWIAQSFTWNPDNPPDNFNGPQSFNDRSNEYQLNQFYVTIEKSLDDEACGLQWGGRIDTLYGTDARFTTAGGLEDKWNNRRFYQYALPQAYVEFGYNDLSVKLGHFYTIIGYEVVPAAENFFLSHAYTMQYGEPFTHTGALFSYKYRDGLTLIGGIDQGWDRWEDDNNRMSFLGGINWTSCDDRTNLALAVTYGDENSAVGGNPPDERAMYSLVLSHQLTDRLSYVFQHDAGKQQRGVANGNDAEWYGINQYLYYDINCCWTAGVRFEWFRDDDGTRVAGLDAANTSNAGGFAGNFYEISLGLNYKPSDNWVIRPEARFDWYSGPNGAGGIRPYDSGTDSSQASLAFDVIWSF